MGTVEIRSRSFFMRFYDLIERLITFYIPGCLVTFCCVFITVEVLCRYFFNYSFIGLVELVEQIVAMLTFLALGAVQRGRNHLVVDILPKKLTSRRAGFILDCILLSVGIFTMASLFGMASWAWIQSYKEHEQISTLVWPKWPFVLAMPLGILFMVLRLIIQLRQSFLHTISFRSPVEQETSEGDEK